MGNLGKHRREEEEQEGGRAGSNYRKPPNAVVYVPLSLTKPEKCFPPLSSTSFPSSPATPPGSPSSVAMWLKPFWLYPFCATAIAAEATRVWPPPWLGHGLGSKVFLGTRARTTCVLVIGWSRCALMGSEASTGACQGSPRRKVAARPVACSS